MLEAVKSLDHFLDRARLTSLRHFIDRLNAPMSSHAIERALRVEWRDYVAEVAAWAPPTWQPAVIWVAYIPDLLVLDRLLSGDAPGWTRDDPIFAPFASSEPEKRVAVLDDSPFAPLSPANDRGATMSERWLTQWRALWPHRCAVDCRWLDELAKTVADHFGQLARAGVQETSIRYRHDLARAVTRMFRRRSGTPVALFAHLVLLALDLERLRGGVMRRRLFAAELKERTA